VGQQRSDGVLVSSAGHARGPFRSGIFFTIRAKACWVISLASTAAYRFRSFPVSRPFQNRSTCLKGAKDWDWGEPRGSAPPTPPYVRVRMRRFERLR
jgi:hypothetical protein